MSKNIGILKVGNKNFYLYKENVQGIRYISAFEGKANKTRSNFVAESAALDNELAMVHQLRKYLEKRYGKEYGTANLILAEA